MAVYVDDFEVEATVGGRNRRWSHLVADSHDELVRFGRKLRLSTAWLQKPGTHREHFDVTSAVRRRALRLGAISVDYVQMQEVLDRKSETLRAIRAGLKYLESEDVPLPDQSQTPTLF